MITPIALGAVKRYVAKDDKENPTTWLLGSIDSIAKTKILSESISVNMDDLDNPKINANINPLEQDLLIVRMGLKGYENFSVPYKTEKLNNVPALTFVGAITINEVAVPPPIIKFGCNGLSNPLNEVLPSPSSKDV